MAESNGGKLSILPMASAIIRDSMGRVLLLKRSGKSRYGRGLWQFPEGRLEFGEEPIEAVSREVEEETQCRFKPQDNGVVAVNSEIIEVEGDRYQLLRLVYAGSLEGEISVGDEHSEFGWFGVSDILEKKDIMAGVREAVRTYAERDVK